MGIHDRYCEQSGRSENTTFQFTKCFAVRVTLRPGLLPATLPLPARPVVVHVAGLFVEQVRVQLYTVLVSKLSGAILAMKGQLKGQTRSDILFTTLSRPVGKLHLLNRNITTK